MNRATINQIEAQAEDLLIATFGTADRVPLAVDMNRIAQHLNLSVRLATFREQEVSGYYVKADRTIYVARVDPPVRQFFTIAHEVGHYMRHDDLPSETWYRRDSVNLAPKDRPREQEANWFAAALLMPRRMVSVYWAAYRDPTRLASLFGVSTAAMTYRLKNLGLTT